jgi:hypothetical protein
MEIQTLRQSTEGDVNTKLYNLQYKKVKRKHGRETRTYVKKRTIVPNKVRHNIKSIFDSQLEDVIDID